MQVTADHAGVSVRVPGASMGTADLVQRAETVTALADALPGLLSGVRAAVDGRAMFRARGLTALGLAQHLCAALREHDELTNVFAQGGLDDGFPRRWPKAEVVQRQSAGSVPLVALEERPASASTDASGPTSAQGLAPCVVISIDGHEVKVCPAQAPERAHPLDELMPDLLARARRRAARLTPLHLEVDQRYEVLAPFGGCQPGQALRFLGRHADLRGDLLEYRFATLDGDGAQLTLVDGPDRHVLDELHRYLARAGR